MLARDVMVFPVITVGNNATVREVANILLKERISAVPVVGNADKVIGIVTESDLMHRAEAGTERPYSWWLHFLTDDATIAADYVKSHAAKVQDVMTSDVVTAAPETPLHEIATLLEERRIKHVPIVNKDGNLVGIVSRANLIQADRQRPAKARSEPSQFDNSTEVACRIEKAFLGAHPSFERDGNQRNCRPLGLC